MTFTCENYVLCGARDAGYEFDPSADRIVDEALCKRLVKEQRGRLIEDKLDGIFDFDSPLYQGEDGKFYAVEMVWEDEGYLPLCWHLLKKKED